MMIQCLFRERQHRCLDREKRKGKRKILGNVQGREKRKGKGLIRPSSLWGERRGKSLDSLHDGVCGRKGVSGLFSRSHF